MTADSTPRGARDLAGALAAQVIEDAEAMKRTRIVGISGGPGSGKSTLAAALVEAVRVITSYSIHYTKLYEVLDAADSKDCCVGRLMPCTGAPAISARMPFASAGSASAVETATASSPMPSAMACATAA